MVNDLGGIDELELMPLGGGYMVRRERLMNELIAKGRKAGIVVLYAPDGFGKTSVLLQYTHEVKCDPTRGPVRIIEADRAIGREVFMQLEVVTEELKDKPHSLIAIDNVPNLDQHDTEDLIDRIRGLRAMGVGVFISCRPSNRQLIHGLGDSVKINAQMLKVHAYEYSAWASAFSISTSLDFYQLTQGVPELVSALQTGLYGQGDVAGLLENEIVNVYGAALVDLASLDNNALFCVACLMVLMGEGNIAELEACGVGCRWPTSPTLYATTRSLAWTPPSGVLRVWARRITDACVCVSWWPRFAPNLFRGRPGFCLRRADAMRRWAWRTPFWTVRRSLNLLGSMGSILL